MTKEYIEVAERIRDELHELAQVSDRIKEVLSLASQYPNERLYLFDSIALNLHGFYSGVESLFHRIAKLIDNTVPSGSDWHRNLLLQMGRKVPNVREQVLSEEMVEELGDYLKFRHVVRNAYTFELDIGRVEELARRLTRLFPKLSRDLEEFALTLVAISEGNDA